MLPPPEMTPEQLAEFFDGLKPGQYNLSIVDAADPFLMPEGGTIITVPNRGKVATIWEKVDESITLLPPITGHSANHPFVHEGSGTIEWSQQQDITDWSDGPADCGAMTIDELERRAEGKA